MLTLEQQQLAAGAVNGKGHIEFGWVYSTKLPKNVINNVPNCWNANGVLFKSHFPTHWDIINIPQKWKGKANNMGICGHLSQHQGFAHHFLCPIGIWLTPELHWMVALDDWCGVGGGQDQGGQGGLWGSLW